MNTYKVTLQSLSGSKRNVYIKGVSQSEALHSSEFMCQHVAGDKIVNCELAKAIKMFEIIVENNKNNYTSVEVIASTKSEAINIIENQLPLLSKIVEVNQISRRK